MASVVKIEKLNETYLRVYADEGILREISEMFTFTVPGFRHMPKFRSGQWSGKISLFSEIKGLLYVGLLSNLYKFLKTSNYQIEFIKNDRYQKLSQKGSRGQCL